MEHNILRCVTFVIFGIYSVQNCIQQKVKVISIGKVYYIGLFSINITENQPDIRRSDAFGKYVQLTEAAYHGSESYLMSFAYTAYEMCDNKTFMKHVILSLLLDEEYNLPSETTGGMSSRIAAIFTHLSTSLTTVLLASFSFENIPVVSQLFENRIYNNKNDLVPFYYPATPDLLKHSYMYIDVFNIAKLYSSNHVIIVCLTNEAYFKHICNGVIEQLSNEINSCFSVAKSYSEDYMDEVVQSIASKDENKTTIIVIGNVEQQEMFMLKLVNNKVYGKNIISYGFTQDYEFTSHYTWLNETAKKVFKRLKYLELRLLWKTDMQYMDSKELILNTWYKNVTDGDILSFEFDLDVRYITVGVLHLFYFTNLFGSTLKLISDAKKAIRYRLHYAVVRRTHFFIPYSSIFYHALDKKTINIDGRKYEINQLKKFSCPKKKCNKSNEPILIKRRYGIWNYSKQWVCQQCQENFIQPNNDVNTICAPCPTYLSSNANNTECIDANNEIYLSLQNLTVLIPLFIVVVSIIMVLMTLVVFINFSESSEIKASNKIMTMVQIVVFLFFFVSFPVLMIGRPGSIKCHTRTMIFGYTFSIVASILLVKSNKLLKIFNADVRFTKGEIRKSKLIDVLTIMVFLMLETVLTFAMIVIVPPKVLLKYQMKRKEKKVFCSNNQHFVVYIIATFVIFLISIVQCFRMRKLPGVFNEAREILYAILMADFVLALTLLLFYSRSTKYDQDYVILLMLSIMAASFYFLLFYKKMLLLFQHEKMKSKAVALKQPKRSTDMTIK